MGLRQYFNYEPRCSRGNLGILYKDAFTYSLVSVPVESGYDFKVLVEE